MNDPIFMSDGEVDPISHEPRPAPRIPRQVDQGDWETIAPHVNLAIALGMTAGAIVWLWGAIELVRWVWRLLA